MLRAEGCAPDTEVSLLLTDDRQISILNRDYRGSQAPTDVLAFSQVEGGIGPETTLLGDVVISVETARRQAGELGHSLQEEVEVLFAHGLLHLLGYDHQTPEDELVMSAKQQEYS